MSSVDKASCSELEANAPFLLLKFNGITSPACNSQVTTAPKRTIVTFLGDQSEKARRAQEEKVLIATEKAELVAKGIPESEAKNQAATASGQLIASTSKTQWKSVLGGLVTERNILVVALAAMILLLGTILSHWRLSLAAISAAILLLLVSSFMT